MPYGQVLRPVDVGQPDLRSEGSRESSLVADERLLQDPPAPPRGCGENRGAGVASRSDSRPAVGGRTENAVGGGQASEDSRISSGEIRDSRCQ